MLTGEVETGGGAGFCATQGSDASEMTQNVTNLFKRILLKERNARAIRRENMSERSRRTAPGQAQKVLGKPVA
jgi:hypothetical protein